MLENRLVRHLADLLGLDTHAKKYAHAHDERFGSMADNAPSYYAAGLPPPANGALLSSRQTLDYFDKGSW